MTQACRNNLVFSCYISSASTVYHMDRNNSFQILLFPHIQNRLREWASERGREKERAKEENKKSHMGSATKICSHIPSNVNSLGIQCFVIGAAFICCIPSKAMEMNP